MPGGYQLLAENAQDFKFVGGSQSVSVKMAEALGSRVLLNAPVSSIQWSSDRSGGGKVTTRSGLSISCDHIVIAMAPSLYGRIQFSPPLPSLRCAPPHTRLWLLALPMLMSVVQIPADAAYADGLHLQDECVLCNRLVA